MRFAGIAALLTPLFVTLIVCAVARREGTPLPKGALLRLVAGTAAALAVFFFRWWPVAVFVTAAALFVLLAIPVMQAIERAANERLPEEPMRSASLSPRTIGIYVPLWARCTAAVAALALLAWALARAIPDPQLLPFGLAIR